MFMIDVCIKILELEAYKHYNGHNTNKYLNELALTLVRHINFVHFIYRLK